MWVVTKHGQCCERGADGPLREYNQRIQSRPRGPEKSNCRDSERMKRTPTGGDGLDVFHAIRLPRTENHQRADVQWRKRSASLEGPAKQWLSPSAQPHSRSTEVLFLSALHLRCLKDSRFQEHTCFSVSVPKRTQEQHVSVWSGPSWTSSLYLQAWRWTLSLRSAQCKPTYRWGREGQWGSLSPAPQTGLGTFRVVWP